MTKTASPISILIADDDEEDRDLAKKALTQCRLANDLHFVEDGEALLEFLYNRGRFAGQPHQRPGLILLDLKMPRKDGFAALKEIKNDPALRQIPVVVLTTSAAEEDIFKTYDLGVNSFITKPVTFDGLVQAMTTLGRYWFEIVELPTDVGR